MPSKCYFNNIIRRIASGIWPHAPPQYQSPAQLFVDKVIKDPDEMLMLRLLPALESVPEPSARELAAAATCYLCSTHRIGNFADCCNFTQAFSHVANHEGGKSQTHKLYTINGFSQTELSLIIWLIIMDLEVILQKIDKPLQVYLLPVKVASHLK